MTVSYFRFRKLSIVFQLQLLYIAMFKIRAISTSAVHYYARKFHTIRKFPVTLRIVIPPLDEPTWVNFTSFEHIAEFLQPTNLLRDPTTGHAIHTSEA